MRKRPRKGDEVRIVFWDHVEDHDAPVKCIVWGYVESAKGNAYVIESWRLPDDLEANKDNRKVFTILKKVVIEATILTAKVENDGSN